MPEFISDPALDPDRDMDPEDRSAWMDEAGDTQTRYIVSTTTTYEVYASSYEEALERFNDEDCTFLEELNPEVKAEDD